ncbi:hypothetical protein SEPCBS119000_001143, partial [Sporothrix epigloea]
NDSQGKNSRSGGSKPATSFVTPTDLQSSAAAAATAAASAANMANDAYNNSSSTVLNKRKSSAASAAAAANARTKKSSLPFLRKNPVSSLLGRRKTGASSTDLAAMGTANADGPVYVPIRGTRIHDFSAPGPRHNPTTDVPPATPSISNTAAVAAMAAIVNASASSKPNLATSHSSKTQPRMASPNTNNISSSVRTTSVIGAAGNTLLTPTPQLGANDSSSNNDKSVRMSQSAPQQTPAATTSLPISQNLTVTSDGAQGETPTYFEHPVVGLREEPMRILSQGTLQAPRESRSHSLNEEPMPGEAVTHDSLPRAEAIERPDLDPKTVSEDREDLLSVRPEITTAPLPATSAGALSTTEVSPSADTILSRNVSISDLSPQAKNTGGLPLTSNTTPISASFQPRHMKSTSSRFSFMIGSASEEKLLEERHRKKEAEKKALGGGNGHGAGPAKGVGTRDSRFDDFDEDDFDYDAVMNGDDADYGEDDAHLFGGQDDSEDVEVRYSGLDEGEASPRTSQLSQISLRQSITGNAAHDFEGSESTAKTVHAEAEDDDPEGVDPDNDQENFAGFVFQRSNQASSMISPANAGVLLTPLDTPSQVVSFAMTSGEATSFYSPSESLSPLDAENTTVFIPVKMPTQIDTKTTEYGVMLNSRASDDENTLDQYELDDFSGDDSGNDCTDEYGKDNDRDQETTRSSQNEIGLISSLPQKQEPNSVASKVQLEDRLPGNANMAVLANSAAGRDDDDLYYDQGLLDELDFGTAERSGPAFDESIFDFNDTDEYGRPIPGAFAAAQASQQTAMAANIEAATDSKSNLPVAESKADDAHCVRKAKSSSLASEDGQRTGLPSNRGPSSQFAGSYSSSDPRRALRRQLPPILTDAQRVDEYQAALAAAAHLAAASGKFRRDSSSAHLSPESTSSPPTFQVDDNYGTGLGLQGLSLGDDGESAVQASSSLGASDGDGLLMRFEDGRLGSKFENRSVFEIEYGYEDDNDAYTQDIEDYDFDDAIIAEANAEALANDMDGFYGQEFNFYSAPGHQPRNSTEREGIQFANGGYFIPAGVGRSISGRVVSREPNLTPITERSEYSNRNSVMSLAVPPFGSSSELRSPGLSQLALVAEGDNTELSLSSLLRLRNRTFGGAGSQASLNSSREGSPMPLSGSYSNQYYGNRSDNERDRGDRDNASSPFAGPTPSQLLLLQKQYPLPAQYQYQHRSNANLSISPRGGAASSCLGSDNGSESGSPTLTSMLPADPGGSGSSVPPRQSPTYSALPNLISGHGKCPPVPEEEDETIPETEVVAQSDLLPYETYRVGASGISSASESGLWMQSPVQRDNSRTSSSRGGEVVGSSSKERHTLPPARRQQLRQKQFHDFEVQALEQQLQVKECETEQIQKQIQQLLLLQQQQQQQMDPEYTSPISPQSPLSPFGMPSRRPKGHRHKSSSDSISYIREEEEETGESRWVMERRRLADTGEIEIEREVVDQI